MTDWLPDKEAVERAVALTHRLRTSTRPQWRDAQARLGGLGLDINDVVLTQWESEGEHLMCGTLVSHDERVVDFCIVYDYGPEGQALEEGEAWISRWTEIPAEDIGPTPAGYPNSWAYAVIVARLVRGRDPKIDQYARPSTDLVSLEEASSRGSSLDSPQEEDVGRRCLTCRAVDHSHLSGEFWPPIQKTQPTDEWVCPKCGSPGYARALVTIGKDGRVFDESGTRIALKLVQGRVYLVARQPRRTQAWLRYLGGNENELSWAYKDAPQRHLTLPVEMIEWIDV